MSTQIDGQFRSFTFQTAISAYRLVQPGVTAGVAIVATSGTDKAIGVTQDDVAANGVGTVKLFCPTYLSSSSGTCAVGDSLSFDAAGQVTTLAANTASAGIALEAATATSAVIDIAIPLNK